MNNFHTSELRELLAEVGLEDCAVFAGRAAFVALPHDRRARVEFVEVGTKDVYSAVRVTILDIKHGEIDRLTLRFKDYFSAQKTGGSTIIPHIWEHQGEPDWYIEPTTAEYSALAKAVLDYILVMN